MKPFNICDTLRKRLQEINDKKDNTQAKIKTSSEQLQRLFSNGPKNTRQTTAQIDAKIDELECRRTATSIALKEEKDILRQIKSLGKAKIQCEENKAHERLIQEKKAEVSALRTELNNIKAQISELETALSKVELAEKLGCTANDLQTHVVPCPVSKLGHIIGKSGSNIKKLEKENGCLIGIDKVKSEIHLQGNEVSIAKAVKEIEGIVLSIEEQYKIDRAVHSVLFAKRMSQFNIIQKNHPNVDFDFSKESLVIKLRGKQEYVDLAKESLSEMNVKMGLESITASGREVAVVVGKSGCTINRLIDTYDVSIEVKASKTKTAGDEDESTITISGYEHQVDGALQEIKNILFQNESIQTSILLSSMTRNKLLANSGELIKVLQKDINTACQPGMSTVRFEDVAKEDRDLPSLLTLTSARMHIDKAESILNERIDAYNSTVITMQIDSELIPVVIGPKGAMIKSLKKLGGPGSDIDIEKLTGIIKIMSNDNEMRNKVKNAIDKIVDENQILKVPVLKSMFSLIYGPSGKAKDLRSKIEKSNVFMRPDDIDTTIVLRGSIENITSSAEDIRQFTESNQTVELVYSADYDSLFTRRNSVLHKIGKEHDVRASVDKNRNVITLRGCKKSIQAVQNEINKMMFGGEGYIVERLFVPISVLGKVIGKQGKNITKYESENKPVIVNLNRLTNCISIHGPAQEAMSCRGMVIKDLSQTDVNEEIKIESDAFDKLSKPGTIGKITMGAPVQVKLSETHIRLRGSFCDVQATLSQIVDLINGVYLTSVTLTPSHFDMISSSKEVQSRFDDVSKATSTTVTLEKSKSAIVVEGKRSNAKRAKTMLISALETALPSKFMKIKIFKPLLKNIGTAKDFAKILIDTGCMVSLDRDICSFIVQSNSSDQKVNAAKLVEDRVKECSKLIQVFQVNAWLAHHLLTQYADDIETVGNKHECHVTVSKTDLIVCIIGKQEDNVTKARQIFDSIIDQVNKENAFVDLPKVSVKEFFGATSRIMKKIASDHGVQIDRVKKTESRIRIQGDPESVALAFGVVNDWVQKWKEKNNTQKVSINSDINNNIGSNSNIDQIISLLNVGVTEQPQLIVINDNKVTSNHEDKENDEKPFPNGHNKKEEPALLQQKETKSKVVMDNRSYSVDKLFDLLASTSAPADYNAVSMELGNGETNGPSSSYCKSKSGFLVRL